MDPLHPLQVGEVRFDFREIVGLMVEVAEWDLRVAELTLERRGAGGVRARVVLAGGPSLLHAGRVVQRLRLIVSVPRPLAWVHAVLPTALNPEAPDPGVGHLVHVWHAEVHREEQGTPLSPSCSLLPKLQKDPVLLSEGGKNPEAESKEEETFDPVNPHSHTLHRPTAPPATTRPNWEAEIYDDAGL